jgi:DNA-binding CsgD family transcriptional regulator
MPVQDSSFGHHHVSRAEAAVLALLARGMTDEEIATKLDVHLRAVRARLQRFYDRTGISGRRAVAWSVEHRPCCINQFSA